MNYEEAVLVLRKVRAYRPSQIIDDLTSDAWQEAFYDIRYEDALLAVRNLGRLSSKYLDPAQILAEVEREAAERKHSGREPKCFTCGGTWEQCARLHAKEVRTGVSDPHDFESSSTAERNTVPRPEEINEQLKHLLDHKNLRSKDVG
jgi:hypothetical protein